MTELYREYRRCGGCRYHSKGHVFSYCYVIEYPRREVNPGWFGCRHWKSLKQVALALLRTGQGR